MKLPAWVLLLSSLCGAPMAWAQPGGPGRQEPWSVGLSAAWQHQFDAGLQDAPGNVSVSRLQVQPSIGYARDRRTSVSLALGLGEARYDFSSRFGAGSSEPWRDIRDISLSVPIRFSPAERADVMLIPSVRSEFERGASLGDGRTEGVIAAAGWKFSDTLTLGPGLGWFSELGGGSNVFPIVLVDWKITDTLTLTTGGGVAVAQGPGITLAYKPAGEWQLGLTASYARKRFALDGQDAGAEGFGEDESVPLLVSCNYQLAPGVTVGAMLGAKFAGSLRRENARGRTLLKTDFETAPFIGLVFAGRF